MNKSAFTNLDGRATKRKWNLRDKDTQIRERYKVKWESNGKSVTVVTSKSNRTCSTKVSCAVLYCACVRACVCESEFI